MEGRSLSKKSKELFDLVLLQYKNYLNDADYGWEGVDGLLTEMTQQDIADFCLQQGTVGVFSHISGLWLACQLMLGYKSSGWGRRTLQYGNLIERIGALSAEFFSQLDFTITSQRIEDKSKEVIRQNNFGKLLASVNFWFKKREFATSLLHNLLTLPEDKIQTLSLGDGPYEMTYAEDDNPENKLSGSLVTLIQLFRTVTIADDHHSKHPQFAYNEWHPQFVNFLDKLSPILNEEDLKIMKKCVFNINAADPRTLPASRKPIKAIWSFEMFCILNQFKCYVLELREKSADHKSVLAEITKLAFACKLFPEYPRKFMLMRLATFLMDYNSRDAEFRALHRRLLSQITYDQNQHPKSQELYYQSRDILANSYYAEIYNTVADKLEGMEKALRYMLQDWLHKPDLNAKKIILNIAKSYLFASEENLKATPGSDGGPELIWLNDKLQRVLDHLPAEMPHNEHEDFINDVLRILFIQRNVIRQYVDEVADLRKKLASECAERSKLKDDLQKLDISVKQLQALMQTKETIEDTKLESSLSRFSLWL